MSTDMSSLDFLTIDGVSNLAQVTGKTYESDPRLWKPRVSAKSPTYDAVVRLLPQGIEGLKNKTYPGVKVMYHHLRSGQMHREVKCCKSIPGQTRCPICDALWNRYDEFVKLYGKDDARTKAVSSMGARAEWFTNVLVREDDNDSNNNGQVKVWRHTDAIDRELRAPFDDSANTESKGNDQTARPGSLRDRKNKEKRRFFPHSPTNGVDYEVTVSWDPAKKMTSYDGSCYASESTPLADTKEEMLDILNKCHDLTEFLKDVPTEEEASKIYVEFMNDAAKRSENAAFNKAGFAPEANPNYAQAEQPRTTSVNATEFFGNAAPAAASFQKPVAEAAAPKSADEDLVNFAKSTKAAPAAPAAPAAEEQLPTLDEDADLPF